MNACQKHYERWNETCIYLIYIISALHHDTAERDIIQYYCWVIWRHTLCMQGWCWSSFSTNIMLKRFTDKCMFYFHLSHWCGALDMYALLWYLWHKHFFIIFPTCIVYLYGMTYLHILLLLVISFQYLRPRPWNLIFCYLALSWFVIWFVIWQMPCSSRYHGMFKQFSRWR